MDYPTEKLSGKSRRKKRKQQSTNKKTQQKSLFHAPETPLAHAPTQADRKNPRPAPGFILQSKTLSLPPEYNHKPNIMKLTYIYHSGFAIEGQQSALILDYYKDSEDQYIHHLLTTFPGKPYVLSSHRHPDHFSKEILKWKTLRPDIQYILSNDILQKRLASPHEAAYLRKGDCWQNEHLYIKAFGSTDIGISFLIKTEGKTIFHAGDLNNWHWDEESTPEETQAAEQHFLTELRQTAGEVNHLDLAMFPVDHRLGKNYMRGAEQFLNAIPTRLFAPMHFGESYTEANAFRPYAENAGSAFAAWTHTGQSRHF
jgi:L-ascorbate metabolism protein UlaG (beta-lactamase superfamily)